MVQFLWVCAGSAAGGGARYLMSLGAMRLFGSGFPYGTFVVNLLGSFLLSAIMFVGTETTMLSPTARIALSIGLMGGFTTYATFSYETLKYLQDGTWALALANVLVTVLGCLAAAWLGWAVAKWLLAL